MTLLFYFILFVFLINTVLLFRYGNHYIIADEEIILAKAKKKVIRGSISLFILLTALIIIGLI